MDERRRRCAGAGSTRGSWSSTATALHPEADWSLDLARAASLRRQLAQWQALARLLPRTDVFHFSSGSRSCRKSAAVPAAARCFAEEVGDPLPRLGHPRQDAGASSPTGRRRDAEVVGSYDAIRWVPEAEVIPPGIDLARVRAGPPLGPPPAGDRARALDPPPQGHGARDRRLRGPRRRARHRRGPAPRRGACERYRAADIVVDQLNAGWYGLFAIECMALGKPVVTFLHDEAVRRTEEAFGIPRPARERVGGNPARAARGARRGGPGRTAPRSAPSAAPTSSACTTSSGSPTACSTSTLGSDDEPRRTAQRGSAGHSAIYGLGGLVSRVLAVFLLPLYTRYLDPSDLGARRARRRPHRPCSSTVLRCGISSRVLPLLLRRRPTRPGAACVLRTSLLVHDGRPPSALVLGVVLADPVADAALGVDDRRPRPRRCARVLGADGLRAADRAVPRRRSARPPSWLASLANVAAHDRRHRSPRRRPRAGGARRDRRQLHRDAARLRRPARVPARAARPGASTGRSCAR